MNHNDTPLWAGIIYFNRTESYINMENRYYNNDHTDMIHSKKIRVIKAQARENLLGKYSPIIAGTLLIQILSDLISTAFIPMLTNAGFFQYAIYYVANFIISMLINFFYVGVYKMHLNASRGSESSLGELIFPVRNGTNRFLIVAAVLTLITYAQAIPRVIFTNYVNLSSIVNGTIDWNMAFTWAVITLIGVVINIILMLNFALAFYFLIDNPDMTAKEALASSHRYMKGNKLRLFFQYISFIGLYLLGILTAGIAYLWLLPYVDQSVTVLYETLVQPEHSHHVDR